MRFYNIHFFVFLLSLFVLSCGVTARYSNMSYTPLHRDSNGMVYNLNKAAMLYAEPKRYLAADVLVKNISDEPRYFDCEDVYIKMEDSTVYHPTSAGEAVKLERQWFDGTMLMSNRESYLTADAIKGDVLKCDTKIPPKSQIKGRVYFELPLMEKSSKVISISLATNAAFEFSND